MILFTADWHIKLGQKNVPMPWACSRYELFFQQVEEAVQKHDITLHIIGGDLFDRVPSMDELTLYFDFVKNTKVKKMKKDRKRPHQQNSGWAPRFARRTSAVLLMRPFFVLFSFF